MYVKLQMETAEEEKNSSSMMVTEATDGLYEPKQFTDEELQKSIEKMMKSKRAPRNELQHPMLNYITKRLPKAVDEQKYKEAQDLEQASKMLRQFMDPKSGYFRECQKRQDEKEKYANIKVRLQEAKKQWDAKMKDQEQQKEARIKELQTRHKQECIDFQEEWAQPEYIQPFHKPSAALIQLKDAQKSYAKAKLFDRAEDAKKRAEELEKQEIEAARTKAIATMKLAFENLQERHDKEMECLMIKEKKETERIQHDRELAIRPIQIQMSKMKDEIDYHSKKRLRPTDYAREVHTKPIRTKTVFNEQEDKAMLPLGKLNPEKFIKARSRQTRY